MPKFAILYLIVLLGCCTSWCSCRKRTDSRSAAKEILKEDDYYKILGVDRKASDADIKRAFRKLAVQYHPDKNNDPDAVKVFQKLGAAYDTLADTEKRRQYDLGGSGAFNFNNAGASFDFSNFNFDNLFGDFGDDLDDAFGSLFGNKKFKLFDDEMPNIFDSMETLRNFAQQNDHFGGGDSFFGGEFARVQRNERNRPTSYQQQYQTGRNCRTVTKQVGNTISTHTICN